MVRRAWLLLLGLVLVALAIGGWSGYRALQAKDDLTQAQAMTTTLQSDLTEGRADQAVASLKPLKTVLDRAESRTSGVAWSIAQHFPVFGRNLAAIRRTTQAAQVLGDEALPEATQALDLVRTKQPLKNGRVDLTVLAQLTVHLDKASAASAKARKLLAPDRKPLLSIIRTKVQEAQTKVGELDDTLQAAARALDVAPTMLGRDGPRTYFVAVQNNAESRGSGGLVGAYAVVKTDHGAITLEKHGPDTDFGDKNLETPLPSDPQAAQTWILNGSTRAWFAATMTPHFPDAAQNMAGLWTHQTGQKLDGVFGIDPIVMSDLMAASGPVALPDGTKVDSGSIVDFVMRDEYVRYPAGPPRKLILSALAADVFNQVIKTSDAVATLKAFGKAGSSGHLLVWSAHPEEQKRLSGGLAGGTLPTTDTPYLSVLTQNFAGNKLDYYLRRTVAVTRSQGKTNVTITLRNTAPTGLPDYVTMRSDHPNPPVPYGQSRLVVSVYGALSSSFGDATLDGKPVKPDFDTDHGHRFGSVQVELPRGKDVTLTFVLSEPAGVLAIRQQPLVTVDTYEVGIPHSVRGS